MATPGSVSLAFTGPVRKTRRLDVHDADEGIIKQTITGFSATGGVETAEPTAGIEGALKVIAGQPNTFRNSDKFRPSFLPGASDAIDADGINKFEMAAADVAEAQQEVTYGLIRRDRGRALAPEAGPSADAELQSLRQDLKQLPEVASLEAYEAMPVEAFGAALLRGLGWREGAGVGSAKRAAPEPRELKRRPARLGLGATAAPAPASHKRHIKPGEQRVPAGTEGVTVESKGDAKIPLAERPASSLKPGQRAWIVKGSHAGVACVLQRWEPEVEGRSLRATVTLLPSEEPVRVRASELSWAPPPSGQRRPESASRPAAPSGEGRARLSRGRERDREGVDAARPGPSAPWLFPHIRVKVVDKAAQGGGLYLKKATVLDVPAPRRCDVALDADGRRVTGLSESQLETVVPSAEGAPVLVVGGRFRGRRGRLLRRDTERGVAAVHVFGEQSIARVDLDHVAQFVGPEADHDDE